VTFLSFDLTINFQVLDLIRFLFPAVTKIKFSFDARNNNGGIL
jgi:hypothetical protein